MSKTPPFSVEALRKMDPTRFKYIIVGPDGQPVDRNAHGRPTRWAFTQRAAAETAWRRALRFCPGAKLV